MSIAQRDAAPERALYRAHAQRPRLDERRAQAQHRPGTERGQQHRNNRSDRQKYGSVATELHLLFIHPRERFGNGENGVG